MKGSMVSEEAVIFGFRCGADMDPTRVRQATPDARFVARGRLIEGTAPLEVVGPPESERVAVWGILLSIPASPNDPPPDGVVITDDGRRFEVRVLTAAGDVADHGETAAAARYWELPPDYVRQLAADDPTE